MIEERSKSTIDTAVQQKLVLTGEIAEPWAAADQDANRAMKIEEILRRAQEIHSERGGVFGYDLEDWLQAWRETPEREIGSELELIETNRAGSEAADVCCHE